MPLMQQLPAILAGGDQPKTTNHSWERVYLRLRSSVGSDTFNAFLTQLHFHKIENGIVFLSTSNQFLKNWVFKHHLKMILEFWNDEYEGDITKIIIAVRRRAQKHKQRKVAASTKPATKNLESASETQQQINPIPKPTNPPSQTRVELNTWLSVAQNDGIPIQIAEKSLEYLCETFPEKQLLWEVFQLISEHVQLCIRYKVEIASLDLDKTKQLIASFKNDKYSRKNGESKELISSRKKVEIEDIQRIVCWKYNISKRSLLSNGKGSRTHSLSRVRQIAMYLCKKMTPRSLPEIGRRFGGRDHTTVLHAIRRVEKLLKDDSKLGTEIATLKNNIHESM